MSGENYTKRGFSCSERIWLGGRMRSRCDLKIAGESTCAHWDKLKEKLTIGRPDNWKEAYGEFFFKRLDTRYFEPINARHTERLPWSEACNRCIAARTM